MTDVRMPIPSRADSLKKGAAYIEQELHNLRKRSIELYEITKDRQGDKWDGRVRPITSSHEGDLMWAVELATAATTLRMLAEREKE
jgi:hypothetical protein